MYTLKSSGKQTSDTLIASKAAIFGGAEIITDGTNDAKIIVYNNTSAAGQILFEGTVTGSANFGGVTLTLPVRADLGIYVDVTGTGAAYIVYFDLA